MASVLQHANIMLTVFYLILLIQYAEAFSTSAIDSDEEYVADSPYIFKGRAGVFGQAKKVKGGAHCDPITNNICNGLPMNNRTGVSSCCKTHCRNVMRDQNNCGKCGVKCGFGELCCHGNCTSVANDVGHCGKCHNKCLPGVKCEHGTCGYA